MITSTPTLEEVHALFDDDFMKLLIKHTIIEFIRDESAIVMNSFDILIEKLYENFTDVDDDIIESLNRSLGFHANVIVEQFTKQITDTKV
jgi:hypothetical protein